MCESSQNISDLNAFFSEMSISGYSSCCHIGELSIGLEATVCIDFVETYSHHFTMGLLFRHFHEFSSHTECLAQAINDGETRSADTGCIDFTRPYLRSEVHAILVMVAAAPLALKRGLFAHDRGREHHNGKSRSAILKVRSAASRHR
jgi:hypothetical protein